MSENKEFLYFDIETVKGDVSHLTVDSFKAAKNIKDPFKIEANKYAQLATAIDKAGLNSFTAKICVISWAFDDEPVQTAVGINEIDVMKAFAQGVAEADGGFTWVGHNALTFDIPFIYHRSIKHGLKELKAAIPSEKYSDFIHDTMKMISPTDYKAMISLDSACVYFGIPTPKDGIDGSKVQGLYDAGAEGLTKIANYCEADVEALRSLHKKLTL
jgi:predicted PolB exonuclease-like 3'-5' exonuclease